MHQLEHDEVPWAREDVTAVAAVVGVDAVKLVGDALAASKPADDGPSSADEDRRPDTFITWAQTLSADEWLAVVDEVEQSHWPDGV